jgi:hypothetical protein
MAAPSWRSSKRRPGLARRQTVKLGLHLRYPSRAGAIRLGRRLPADSAAPGRHTHRCLVQRLGICGDPVGHGPVAHASSRSTATDSSVFHGVPATLSTWRMPSKYQSKRAALPTRLVGNGLPDMAPERADRGYRRTPRQTVESRSHMGDSGLSLGADQRAWSRQ